MADLPHPSSNWADISGKPVHQISFIYSTMHIYIWQIYPPHQSSIDALNTATPNLADLPQRTSTYKRPCTCEGNYLISFVITLQLTIFLQLKCSFSIVVIFNCCHFATDHPHAVKTLIVSLCVQMMKFKSYFSSYQPMQKTSNWKSDLDMERWLTPWRTSTHERPFTWEGNYLVFFLSCFTFHYCHFHLVLFIYFAIFILFCFIPTLVQFLLLLLQ